MATFWEKLQRAAKAAAAAWQGTTPGVGEARAKDLAFIDALTPAQRERLKKYDLLWDYYLGKQKKQLKVATGQADDNVIINHSRRIVNLSSFFLFGKEVRWELTEGKRTADEKKLDEIWGRSTEQRMALLSDVAINGGVCGTAFLQLLPPDDRHDMPRIVNLNPALVFPQWNPDDLADVWVYELRWRSDDKVKRDIYTLTESGGWEIWHEELVGPRWAESRPKETWPWQWAPIVHAKNLPLPNEFWGLSDLEDADLNDAVNFIASNTNRILRLFAHPQLWGYGFGEGNIAADPGKIIMARNPQANLQMLQMAGSMGASDTYLHALTEWFYSTAQSIELNPQTASLGAQSGFALRVLHQPLLQTTEIKRQHYGAMIIEANRRLLDMLGRGDDKLTTLHWQDPLPLDEGSQTAWDKFELEMGLASKETVATRRGLDWEQEQERLAKEKEAALAEQQAQSNVGAELLKAFERGAMPSPKTLQNGAQPVPKMPAGGPVGAAGGPQPVK